jgi:hypothetical protein
MIFSLPPILHLHQHPALYSAIPARYPSFHYTLQSASIHLPAIYTFWNSACYHPAFHSSLHLYSTRQYQPARC